METQKLPRISNHLKRFHENSINFYKFRLEISIIPNECFGVAAFVSIAGAEKLIFVSHSMTKLRRIFHQSRLHFHRTATRENIVFLMKKFVLPFKNSLSIEISLQQHVSLHLTPSQGVKVEKRRKGKALFVPIL